MKSHPTSCGAEGQAGQGELDLAMGVLKRPQDSIWVTQCRAPCPPGHQASSENKRTPIYSAAFQFGV